MLYAKHYGNPGSIVTCDDNKEYVVVHNDFQSTIILYRKNIFTVLQCYYWLIRPFAPITLCFDITMHENIVESVGTNMQYRNKHVIKKTQNTVDIITFREILCKFNSVISIIDNANIEFYSLPIHYIRDQHTHLLYLCERPLLLIQRTFRKAISNPNYRLCRSRLMREYNLLKSELEYAK